MPEQLRQSDLVEWISGIARDAGRFLVGIAGPPGSGKSTLAEQLATALHAPLVPMDGFHFSDGELAARGLADVKGAPETFDVDGFVSLLEQLRAADRDVLAPRFDRRREEVVPDAIRVAEPDRIVVVEGNYLLLEQGAWSRVADLLDVVIHLEVPADVLRRRLIARHMDFGRSERAATEWVERSDMANAALVTRHARRADAILDDADDDPYRDGWIPRSQM